MAFIVFEGGEGSGKTGVIKVLSEKLKAGGHEVITTREPGGTQQAERIREMLITAGADLNPITNALLFAAARSEHVEKVIKPALEAGKIVLCDRYVLSTIAYQGAGEGVSADFITNLHEQTTDGFYPDLTVIMDIDPEIGLARSNKRLADQQSDENRFEKLDITFHQSVRSAMKSRCHTRKIIIDAARSLDQVQSDVIGQVEDFLRQTPSVA